VTSRSKGHEKYLLFFSIGAIGRDFFTMVGNFHRISNPIQHTLGIKKTVVVNNSLELAFKVYIVTEFHVSVNGLMDLVLDAQQTHM
jgi:hypothetical protein